MNPFPFRAGSIRPAAAVLALVALLLAAGAPTAHAAAASDPPPAAAEVKAPITVVNINTADEKELLTLPKVGPSIAARILEYRKQVGSFKSIDELLNVKGIGEKTLETLRPHVTVGPRSQPAGKP